MDEYKAKIKSKIKDWIKVCEKKTESFNHDKETFDIFELIDFIREIHELMGFREKNWEHRKDSFIKSLYREIKEVLEYEYTRLNRLDNPYKFVPEEWLEMEAGEIIKSINKKWQKELPDGRIEQEYWIEYSETKSDKGTYYTVYQRYFGNQGHHYLFHGDKDKTLKYCVLEFWENMSEQKNFVNNFWD